MIASMEKPDESWDDSSTMNNSFATDIDGNDVVAVNSPPAGKRPVPMPRAKFTPQQGRLKLSNPLQTRKMSCHSTGQ